MEHNSRRTTSAAAAEAEGCGPYSLSPTSSAHSDPSSQSPPAVILSPCAACKFLRRRCVEKCVLAPYFPPTDPLKFTIAHRVFGASNIIKFLQVIFFSPNTVFGLHIIHVINVNIQELDEDQRVDAVNSMVYEANARLRDPVYGCTGTICHLQKQISELQAQVAKAQAEIANMQSQNADLYDQLIMCKQMKMMMTTQNYFEENMTQAEEEEEAQLPYYDDNSSSAFLFDQEYNWDTLWT